MSKKNIKLPEGVIIGKKNKLAVSLTAHPVKKTKKNKLRFPAMFHTGALVLGKVFLNPKGLLKLAKESYAKANEANDIVSSGSEFSTEEKLDVMTDFADFQRQVVVDYCIGFDAVVIHRGTGEVLEDYAEYFQDKNEPVPQPAIKKTKKAKTS